MKRKKTKKWLLTGIVLPIIFILTAYNSIPSKIIITTDYNYSCRLPYFSSVFSKNPGTAQASSSQSQPIAEQNERNLEINSANTGDYNFSVRMFNCLPIKNVTVSVVEPKYVNLGGKTIGVKLYTDGLLVVNTSTVTLSDGSVVSPAREAGIREGDRILSANKREIHSSEDFSEILSDCQSSVELEMARGDERFTVTVPAEKSAENGQIKVGLWVRDSTAGIGTVTFFDENRFAALGHAITDVDTGEIMTINNGSVLKCDILSVKKGERGQPGELVGAFSGQEFGNILINDSLGIYGTVNQNDSISKNSIPIATHSQIQKGDAYIALDIDGSGVKKYRAQIQRIAKNNNMNNKGLVIKIVDEELLSRTGGIVQGMSGAPIIQNDMLIGAVTHVFVNDPTRGYGIFAENMLYMTEKLQK
jgi:stage IV sporulation protein B